GAGGSGREREGADGSGADARAGIGGPTPSRSLPLPPAPSLPRTALIPAPRTDALDPTGCGDVFGAVLCSRLLGGDGVEAALREDKRLAARKSRFRRGGGLSGFLRGELVTA